MKPYFQDDAVQIYLGDCRDILPSLPKVDLVLTDPPYGIALANHDPNGRRSNRPYTVKNDDTSQIGQEILDYYTATPTISFACPEKQWGGNWNQYLVWDKGGGTGGGGEPTMYWYRTWELIQVRSLGRLNGQRDSAVLHYSGRGNELLLHPTQKPEELISYLISKVVANLILDPFMGSGTTLRAAKNLGRKAIGIEIEERYAEIAARRMQQSVLPLEYENKGRTLEGLGSKKSSADNSPMFNL